MQPLSITLATLIALTSAATAQTTHPAVRAERISGAVKHAGIYHVASGTWTRSSSAVANFGPDTIYSNTAASGYYSSAGGTGGFAPGSTNFDEGVLPTAANSHANANRDIYTVNCVSIGYCDFGAAGTSGWELRFYDDYTPCTYEPTFQNELVAAGLPAAGCWIVDFDLTGGFELCMEGDGGDGFQDDPNLDSFGWSFRYTGTDGSAAAGFMLSGDPLSTDPNYALGGLPSDGTNTYFGVPSLCGPDRATGFFTQDFWYLEDPTGVNSNCFFFSQPISTGTCSPFVNPYASWYLELQADTDVCDQLAISSPSGCMSNPNGTGVHSTMEATGSTSVGQNNVTLRASVTPFSFGFFITSQNPGFLPNPAGSAGNLCLGQNIGRFQAHTMSSGPLGEVTLSTLQGQWDLTQIPAAAGFYSATPGTRSYFQCWHRDTNTTGPTSNFTDGCVIVWTP